MIQVVHLNGKAVTFGLQKEIGTTRNQGINVVVNSGRSDGYRRLLARYSRHAEGKQRGTINDGVGIGGSRSNGLGRRRGDRRKHRYVANER